MPEGIMPDLHMSLDIKNTKGLEEIFVKDKGVATFSNCFNFKKRLF